MKRRRPGRPRKGEVVEKTQKQIDREERMKKRAKALEKAEIEDKRRQQREVTIKRVVDRRLSLLKSAFRYIAEAEWLKKRLTVDGVILQDYPPPGCGCPSSTTWEDTKRRTGAVPEIGKPEFVEEAPAVVEKVDEPPSETPVPVLPPVEEVSTCEEPVVTEAAPIDVVQIEPASVEVLSAKRLSEDFGSLAGGV